MQGCSTYALHPTSRLAYLSHQGECGARARLRANRDASRRVTCSICLETVLDNPDKSQRKFGLLDCQHAFCLSCIRQWRSNADDSVDLESVGARVENPGVRRWVLRFLTQRL